jgi:hypothetical protein
MLRGFSGGQKCSSINTCDWTRNSQKLISVFFSRAGNGEPYCFLFVTDVTERKKEQMALQEAKARAELFLDLMSNDIDNMNRVSIRYLELAPGTVRLRPGERELIMTALGSLMNSSRMIGNVRRVQDRDRLNFP